MPYTVTTLGRNAQVLQSTTHKICHTGSDGGIADVTHLTDTIETDGWTKAWVEFNSMEPGSNTTQCEYRIRAWSRNEDATVDTGSGQVTRSPVQSSVDAFWYNDRPPVAFQEGAESVRTSAYGDRTDAGLLVHLPPHLQFSVEAKDYSVYGSDPDTTPDGAWTIKITLQK